MNLTLVISSLGAGGAERVLSTMANHWAARGRSITLLTFDDGTEPPFYPLAPSVVHLPLAIAGPSGSALDAVMRNLHRVRRLKDAIRCSRPDAVLSFMDRTNVLTLLAARGLGVPVVVSERIHPGSACLSRPWRVLRRWTYPQAACVVAQTRAALECLGLSGRVIPNPVEPPPPLSRRDGTGRIVAMGRLAPQKGFDLLMRAFAEVVPSFPGWELTIWGEGSERAALEELRGALGLGGRVHLPGRTRRSHEALASADLFVLSSRFEGFPNVLCEAMACGLPVVAADCPAGPAEIVRHGVDGLLVRPDGIAAAMARLMADPLERSRLAARAPEVVERFSVERVMALWDEVAA